MERNTLRHIALLLAVTATTSVAAFCCIGACAAVISPVPESSMRLNSYNLWHFQSPDDKQTRLNVLAKRDRIVTTEGFDSKGVTPQSIKAIHPDAKVYRLYDFLAKNTWDSDWNDQNDTTSLQTPLLKSTIDANDWWLRDGDGKIVEESNETWLLDVGKPGYKEAFLAAILDRNEGKGFDGIVFDYCWADIGLLIGDKPRPAAYPTEQEWFLKAWEPFISYVVDGLHSAGYKVIGNAGQYNTNGDNYEWTRSKFDGVVYERWGSTWRGSTTEWFTGKDIEARINAFATDPREVWVSDYGTRLDDANYQQHLMVAVALYYIAVPSALYEDRRSFNVYRDANVFWEPIWSFSIGKPSWPANKRAGQYLWTRRYSAGLVIFNYQATPAVVALDRTYVDYLGNSYSGKMTIPPYTGLILRLRTTTASP